MFYLASASPRRQELLQRVLPDFEICPADADESLPDGIAPDEAVKLLSARKACVVSHLHPADWVLGADTIVSLDGMILGKPHDEEEALAMLSALSGKTHQVYTGVTLQQGQRVHSFSVCSDVTFYPLSAEEIRSYIQTGEPMDKAGAYGIQGLGALLVERISGDYFNIVGLPIARLLRELRNLAPDLFD